MAGLSQTTREIVSGFVGSLLTLTYCLSYAALIFSGPLQHDLAAGVAAAFIACAVTGFIVALGSGFTPAVSTPVSHSAAPLAVISATMAPMLAANPDQASRLGFAMLFVTTLLTGTTLLVLGRARLGILARYIPYPVVVGFLGATGWLITAGAVQTAAGTPLTPATLPLLQSPGVVLNICLMAAIAAALWWISERAKHFLVLPLALVGLFAATHAVLALIGVDQREAQEMGLLLQAESAGLPPMLLNGGLSGTDWMLLAPYSGYMAAVVGMAFISVLLNATGLELATGKAALLDRELKVQGAANIASAFAGGFVSHTSLSNTLLNRAAGGRGRLSALVVPAVAVIALLAGTDFLGAVPRFILCGILLQLGLKLLWDWVWKTRATLQRRDWAVAVTIVILTAVFGFLQGIIFGLVASCVLFALDASTMSVVRRNTGLDQQRSSVDRPANEMRLLSEHGASIRVLKLHGLVFFGTAQRLLDEIETLAQRKDFRGLVLDFSGVSGMDTSAGTGLSRLLARLAGEGVQILLSGVSPAVLRVLAGISGYPGIRVFARLDDALEAAEEALLAQHRAPGRQHRDIETWLSEELGADIAGRLILKLIPQTPDPDGYLCRQGDPTDTLLFVERAQVSVIVDRPGEGPTRMRLFKAETILGEIGFFLNVPRTAALRSENDAVVWALNREAYADLQKSEPDVVNALLSFVVRVQAERLAFTTAFNASLLADG